MSLCTHSIARAGSLIICAALLHSSSILGSRRTAVPMRCRRYSWERPKVPILEEAGIHTIAFKGPAAGDRSGGLDAVRRQCDQVNKLIGVSGGSRENAWFERGGEGQIDVIRWIKTKIESPGTTRAYLIDPYLGSDALKRVIARQGHENVALTVVVSPGRIDPDADDVDTKAIGDHLAKLVAAADNGPTAYAAGFRLFTFGAVKAQNRLSTIATSALSINAACRPCISCPTA